MAQMPKFSLLLWTNETNEAYYRDLMESLVEQVYDHWELYILDENLYSNLQRIAVEFFPQDPRIHYKSLRNHKGQAYGYNLGFHFGSGDYFVLLGQHDRISKNTLYQMAQLITEHTEADMPDIIYGDHDEIIDNVNQNPHFKPGFDRELLLRRNYIGDFFAISRKAIRDVGVLREQLTYSFCYDYLLRCMKREQKFYSIQSILYHQRQEIVPTKQEKKRLQEAIYREHIAVIKAFILREKIVATVEPRRDLEGWKVSYDGKDYRKHRKEYLVLKDPQVKVLTKQAKEIMYGYLRQEKVGIVGTGFLLNGLNVDHVGYIFDEEGMAYPAFHRKFLFGDSYERLMRTPRQVSMVDFGFCMIDAKLYKRLHGFDTNLSGRDVMLDFCIRVQEAGYRIVVVPEVWAKYKHRENISTQKSNEYLKEKHHAMMEQGDFYYNRNLPMGLENFS